VLSWGSLLEFVYVGILATGLMFSVLDRQRLRRRKIRIATAALSSPIILLGALLVFLRFTIFREPPTLEELQRDFPSRRAALNTLVRMSDQDRKFFRITPDFSVSGQRSDGTLLPKPRLDEYRKVFAQNGIRDGIERDDSRDAFVIVGSVGILNRGRSTGYVHCDPSPVVTGYRFYPCVLKQKNGHREFNPTTRDEAYSFVRLDELWYAYDVGPS
jgi:hypothetical protein